MDYILTVDQYGRRVYKDISTIKGINAETLNSKPSTAFVETGVKYDSDVKWPYRVQSDLALLKIDHSLYVLDSELQTTTLTLPPAEAIENGTEVIFLNTIKNDFVISGNGVKIIAGGVPGLTVTLKEYQSIRLVFTATGLVHGATWYEL